MAEDFVAAELGAPFDPTLEAQVLRCTTAAYYADPLPVPSLSQSIAHVLVNRSPLHAWFQHPRLGKAPRKYSETFEDGTLVHAMLLGKGAPIVAVEAKDWRTNAAKAKREEIRKAGGLALLEGKLAELEVIVDVLRARMRAHGFELDGQSEVAVAWKEIASDGTVVWCRGMFDHAWIEKARLLDLKTISSADPRTCERHAHDYGYHLQRAAYTSAMRKLRPELAGRESYDWLFAELEEPFAVTPAEAGGTMRELGEMLWRRAVDTWAQCTRTNEWPSYVQPGRRLVLEAPAWAMAREIGRLGAEAALADGAP